jgi:hypothetical protein
MEEQASYLSAAIPEMRYSEQQALEKLRTPGKKESI